MAGNDSTWLRVCSAFNSVNIRFLPAGIHYSINDKRKPLKNKFGNSVLLKFRRTFPIFVYSSNNVVSNILEIVSVTYEFYDAG